MHRQQRLLPSGTSRRKADLRPARDTRCRTRQQKARTRCNQQLAAISRQARRRSGHAGRAASAAISQAVAQRDEAQRQLDHTVVKAPFAGIVTNVPAIAPGKYLAASTTAFYLVDTDHVWVDATRRRRS